MVNYSCDKCGKTYTQKIHYKAHQKKKTPCTEQKIDQKLEQKIIKIIPKKNLTDKKLRYIDLFCGIGSFHYSFDKLGFECVMACDINKSARDTYELNYGIKPKSDIVDIDPNTIAKYDILCAGFPCQPFSQAGKHKGFNDERGTMFFHVMKFVKHTKPSVVILENVSALLNHDNGNSMKAILTNLQSNKYTVVYKILKCSDYGIPQMRKRLFIIAVRNNVQLTKNLNTFFDLDTYEKQTSLSDYMGKNFEKETAYTIRCGGRSSPINDRHNWDGYMVDKKEYRLTLDDATKLQGFDTSFKLAGTDTSKWKLLGNTIPTVLSQIVGKQMLNILF